MNRSFTVETRSSCAAIFGGQTTLTSSLIQEFIARGIHAAKINTAEELELLRQTHDPDYLVVFLFKKYDKIISELQPLIDSGESRLITVQNLNRDYEPLPLGPAVKNIYYSDYVGDTELESNLIEGWLDNIRLHHSIVIPGDGLEEISLLSLDDLSKLISLAVLHPKTGVGEVITLGNPTPISLLNLAYLIRTNLAFKISLTFVAGDATQIWSYDGDALQKTLDKLSSKLTDDPESSLKFYLKSWSGQPILESLPEPKPEPIPAPVIAIGRLSSTGDVAKSQVLLAERQVGTPKAGGESPKVSLSPTHAIAESSPKRLTPLRTPQPFFVPLQNRKVRKTMAFKFKLPKISFPAKKALLPPQPVGPPRLRTIVGRGLIIAAALYLGTIAFTSTIAALSLSQIYQSLREDEMPKSNKLNEFAITYLRANWVVMTSIPGVYKNKSVEEINLLLDVYSQAISAFDTAQNLSKSAEELTSYIFGTGNFDVAKIISLSRLQSEDFYQKLSLLDGSLPEVPPAIIPQKYKSYYGESKARLTKLKRGVTTTKALLATMPDVIGLGGRRKYAVLFQNNMELRATGGFIGSFAILSFENGKLYDMPIYDVYDADGQLKGHVEPPAPIKDILGEANWYLRDSNFDPDFPTSARRAEWFIKKSLNQDLDGTIAVNVNTLISLLKSTGPLELNDYKETITGENLYERSQFHAEVNFFPGSTQKKEFLSTVASALFAKLPTLTSGSGIKVVGALADTVQEKNTLISLSNPATDKVFKALGWNGELSDYPCPTSRSCHKDYAMVVDSNFGVNKANYFIKRDIEEVITFDKNLAVGHVLRLTYQNTSTSTAWPAGAYKNFQRLYLPIGSNITSIKVGEKILTSKEYTVSSEHNKLVVSYLALVPISDKIVVVVEYSTPQLPQENELMYTWYWQKQPGTSSADNLTVYLNYPMYLKPVVISPKAEVAPQQLRFDMVNDTDRRITVKFSK